MADLYEQLGLKRKENKRDLYEELGLDRNFILTKEMIDRQSNIENQQKTNDFMNFMSKNANDKYLGINNRLPMNNNTIAPLPKIDTSKYVSTKELQNKYKEEISKLNEINKKVFRTQNNLLEEKGYQKLPETGNLYSDKPKTLSEVNPYEYANKQHKIKSDVLNSDTMKKLNQEKSTQESNTGWAEYYKNEREVSEDNIGWFDKSIGRVIEGPRSMIESFNKKYKTLDENGKEVVLPSKFQMKQSKVANSYDTWLGKFVGDAAANISKLATVSGVNAVAPGAGTAMYWSSMYLDSYDNARQQGYDENKSFLFATTSTALELATEKLLGSTASVTTGGKNSQFDDLLKSVTDRLIKNEAVSTFLSKAGSEATEEFIQTFLEQANRNLTLGENEKIFTKERLEEALYSAGIGAVTGGTLGVADYKLSNKPVLPIPQDTTTNIQDIKAPLPNTKYSKGNTINQNIVNFNIFKYTKTDNQKVNNLMESAVTSQFSNTETAHNFINSLAKIVIDKDIDIVFDNTLQDNVNGKYENGKITINPNSARAGEFIAIHELTHAIGTDSMRNIVDKYRQFNKEFDTELQTKLNNYKTSELSEEAMADVLGNVLGNQEYINNLSLQEPNIFKKIYNEIKYLYHQLRGYKNQSQFIEDLMYKFENAYRKSEVNLNSNTKFSEVYNNDGTVNRIKINENIFENNNGKSINQTIKEYLEQHIGNVYTIIESGQKVYLGKDLPGEYAYSKSAKSLPTTKKLAKGRAASNLQEIVENATNRKWEHYKHESHKTNAKYGFYKYDTTFSFDYNGQEKIYDGTILIRNDADGKKYLYDILSINPHKKSVNLPPVASNSKLSSARFGGSSNRFNDSILPQSNENVNTTSKYSMQNDTKNSDKWQEYLDNNFKPTGTRTNMQDIKLPMPTNTTKSSEIKNIPLPMSDNMKTKLENKKLSEQRKLEIQRKVEKVIENKSYQVVKQATKEGNKYLNFNNKERETFKESMKQFIGMSKEELQSGKTYDAIKKIVSRYADKEIRYVDEDIKAVKKEIRNYKIKVDDNLKNNITDYNDFRKSNFGKLNLSNEGQSIDQIYTELSDAYPYFFDNSINYTEEEMLMNLSDFMSQDNFKIEKYRLSDSELTDAAMRVYNTLSNSSMTNEELETMRTYLEDKFSAKTRQIVQQELLEEMNIGIEELHIGNDINSIAYQRTDPIRVNEKVFGGKVGQKINDATINKTKHNEAERIRFLNKERQEISDLGIKPRSKESAAVQKYAEKEYMTELGEYKTYGEAELVNEFPNINTQNKIRKAALTIRNKYDAYIDEINEVITNLGYDAIPKRKDYMRHFQELGNKLSEFGIPLADLNNDNLPTDINGVTDQFKPGKNWFASAMKREGMKTTYDAITGIDGYLEGASNLIYHTEDIQRYRALSKLIRDTYGQEHGLDNISKMDSKAINDRLQEMYDGKLSKYVAWLDEQANALAGKKGQIDRGFERAFGRKIYGILSTAKKQVGSNMTGFNVRSALTNFASTVQGASKTNKVAFLKGTVSALKNIIHKDNMIDKSDFLTSRFGSNQLSMKKWQKASNAGQILMSATDYFTANQIWRSKYYENITKGMSEKQAIRKADDFSSRVMGDRSKGATAEMFNSKTLGFFTQFQLEVNNQWSNLVHDNKIDVKNGNKTAAGIIFQTGQLFAASYLFNGLFKALTGSDDNVMFDPIDMLLKLFDYDDDDEKDTLEEKAKDILRELVDQIPMANLFTGGGRLPVSEAFTGLGTTVKFLTGQKDKYGNDLTLKNVKNDMISSAFYWLLPTGYGQLKKTIKGLSMYNKKLPLPGSYTDSGNLRFNADTSTKGKIKSALFGQYSSEESQKYMDSGYKSINKNNIQEMKDLNMSASEYRNYKNGLSESGSKNEDKMNYIKKLPGVTNNQKNIMASNVMKKNVDIKEYNKYSSYDEYNYAQKKPEKYKTITQITTYGKYLEYKEKIDDIKETSNNKKNDIIKYVNSLKMSIPQKAMLIKMYYSSFKDYDDEIINYIKKNVKTVKEREEVLTELGFKVKDGRVYK